MRKSDRSRAGSPVASDRVTAPGESETGPVGELRDTELAISLWRRKASEFGGVPPPTAFDFSSMIGGAWNHRFVICTDTVVGELTFLIYGSGFAQLLELPAQPTSGIPIPRQLPGRYLSLFTEGCRDAIAQAAPVRLSGAVVDYGQIELYRAAFMPLAMRQHSLMRLVFGSFNRRIGLKAHSTDAVRATYNSIFEEIQLAKALASPGEKPAPGSTAEGPGC
jgi:hypothetical protein